MTCKLSGLFSLDEDFDEDVLGTDWSACPVPGSASVAAAVSSCSLRASSVVHREQEKMCHQPMGEKLAGLRDGTMSRSGMHSGAAQTVALGLRQISSSTMPASPLLFTKNNSEPQQSPANTEGLMNPSTAHDDFDDWDVDLADLDECDSQTRQQSQPAAPAATEPLSLLKTLRPSTHVRSQTPLNKCLRELSAASKTSSYSSYIAPPRSLATAHLQSPSPCPAFPAASPQTPAVCLNANSPAPRSFSKMPGYPHQLLKPCASPQVSSQACSLFNTVSPAPSPSVNSSTLSAHPLHTPVLTNRLVQLVSASNKLPKKRRHSEANQPRMRRFPGPAGLLPQQCSSSQPEEEEFNGHAWTALKAEMGLDERNPKCFLHTYSVVMVLRKAALKQLPRNKVPNMAILLKSIIDTNAADAKAVFKDPTGEIQGTVHRRLLEERSKELKAEAVLLLKQVGVFSPSHRNHYLNVTPNNLLKIYSPDGLSLSTQLPPFVLEPTISSPAPDVLRQPVFQMQLEFDEEDDEGKKAEGSKEGGEVPGVQRLTQNKSFTPRRGLHESFRNPAPQDTDWDADDDLDELLGEIPEDTYSF
ncbi:homologous recombination OB-fold protein-like isoform X2 [Girardinichthys multiradiatus]|uniref:homologous recombination OB-fold protein-like isoform X2 n=1 Tax=Girardinichthys multiradiatus TaxID=208333 RepID=UPI001FAC5434|nr:homologous recombination OB-fold protein-like isoform X2 [Girardinichthys multiradiatus]